MKDNDKVVIELQNIHKIYKFNDSGIEVRALNGVSLKIRKSEFACIMGASGSGKSTLMNILGCLDRPTSGIYLLEGQNVATLTDDELAEIRNKKIGFVFQGFNLLQRTTAIENVELPMIYAGINATQRRQKALNAIKAVGLEGREYHYPNQLSGGQQQRVAIARALVNNPSIILADEPTGNLDSKASLEIMKIFQQLNSKGHTIVLITHEPDIAQYAERKITLKDGQIISDEPIKNRTIAI